MPKPKSETQILWQSQAREVLLHGGTLGYRGQGILTGDNWQSHVTTVGDGTGPLAGIHGQGTFVFTGPASLTDVIYHVYTP